ncbi:MAG: sulfatase, partial [bacterium]|nr:sulfatase [bacterium]
AEVLAAAGYATGYIGKWHLDGHGREAYIPPQRRQGWDYWKGAQCDHNYNHAHYYTGDSSEKCFWEGYDAIAQTRDAQAYLAARARDERPFALMVSYGVPHFPHATAPQEYKDLYPPQDIKLAPNVPTEWREKARQESQGYYAHCTALDKCIGDIMKTLDETGLAENTILVFTSDHGESMGSHGCPPLQKQVAWDESAHVPFLLRWPAIHGRRGRKIRTPLTTPDVMPTLLGLAGAAAPKSTEGEDLSRVVRGEGEADRAALYMSVAPFGSGQDMKEYRAIRTSRHTYARDLSGPWLLFDDVADPFQMDNLVGKPEHAALQRELDARLQTELRKIGDDFQPAGHYIEAWRYDIKPHGSVSYEPGAKMQSPRRK